MYQQLNGLSHIIINLVRRTEFKVYEHNTRTQPQLFIQTRPTTFMSNIFIDHMDPSTALTHRRKHEYRNIRKDKQARQWKWRLSTKTRLTCDMGITRQMGLACDMGVFKI